MEIEFSLHRILNYLSLCRSKELLADMRLEYVYHVVDHFRKASFVIDTCIRGLFMYA